MIRRKYKHVFFDLDNTLWDFKRNAYTALKQAFNHFQISDLDFDDFFEVYSIHNRLLWEQYRNNQVSKKELVIKRFSNTFAEFHKTDVEPEAINQYYLEKMPEQKLLKEGALDTLHYLKQKKYLLYIITNGFKEVQRKKLTNSGIIDFFEKIYISEDIKKPKPAAEVFEYAVKSSNAKKTSSIMVGDDWEADIIGSLKFGMDAAYFQNEEKKPAPAIAFKNQLYTIGDLAELKLILK